MDPMRGEAGSTAFLSPVVNKGMRKPFGELTNTPPSLKRGYQERTPLKSCAAVANSGADEALGTLTPMANLKLLMRVASETSSDGLSSRRELFKEDQENEENLHRSQRLVIAEEHDHDYSFERRNSTASTASSLLMTPGSLSLSSAPTSASSTSSGQAKVSRKDKSLGLLCDKFISRFPREVPPSERCEIPLDDLAKQMSTERRRIYDIVNVLEAVQMMTKVGKNLYQWHGTSHQTVTLAWLRQLASKLDMLKRYHEVKRLEAEEQLTASTSSLSMIDNDLKRSPLSVSTLSPMMSPFATTPSSVSPSPIERKTSLGVACQKFLMLFLIAPEPNAKINLDFAAKVIHGVGLPEAIMKTRIRRLYDIANILQSLKLIQKVQITEANGGKKPAFQYIGPNIDSIEVTKDVLETLPSTRQRHSLLTFGKSLMNIPDEPPSSHPLGLSPLAAAPAVASQKRPLMQQQQQVAQSGASVPEAHCPVLHKLSSHDANLTDMVLNLSKKKRRNSEHDQPEPENLSFRRSHSSSLMDLSRVCEVERARSSHHQPHGISLLKRALTSPGSSNGSSTVLGSNVRLVPPTSGGLQPPRVPQVAHQSSMMAISLVRKSGGF